MKGAQKIGIWYLIKTNFMVEQNKQVFLNFIQVDIKRLILTKYLKFKDKGFFYKNLSSIIWWNKLTVYEKNYLRYWKSR